MAAATSGQSGGIGFARATIGATVAALAAELADEGGGLAAPASAMAVGGELGAAVGSGWPTLTPPLGNSVPFFSLRGGGLALRLAG